MKKMMLIIAISITSFQAGAQKLNKGTNNQETQATLQINTSSQFEGYKQGNNQMINAKNDLLENNRKWNNIERDDLPYRSIPYDTTKNNGHCMGCGSGTMTDPHLMR